MLKIREGYMLRKIMDEWVVVTIGSKTARPQEFMLLNKTGAQIWQMMQAGAEQEAMAAKLVETYGVDERQADADTAAFVHRLLMSGIAELCGEGALA